MTRKFIIAAGGVCILGALFAGFIFSRTQQREVSPSQQVPPSLTTSEETHAPQQKPLNVNENFQSTPAKPLDALGLKSVSLRAVYEAGMGSAATPQQQYVAAEVLQYCLPVIARRPYVELPNASGDVMRQVMEARSEMKRRCEELERVGLDKLKNDLQTLQTAIEAPGSLVSRNYVEYHLARSDSEKELALNHLDELFKAFGTATLHMQSGEFVNYIEESSGKFPMAVKAIAPERSLYNYGALIAMCESEAICSSDGLLYTAMCADYGNCGGSVQAAMGVNFSVDETRRAESVAKLITTAISNHAWDK